MRGVELSAVNVIAGKSRAAAARGKGGHGPGQFNGALGDFGVDGRNFSGHRKNLGDDGIGIGGVPVFGGAGAHAVSQSRAGVSAEHSGGDGIAELNFSVASVVRRQGAG